jgi:hypothetical protein
MRFGYGEQLIEVCFKIPPFIFRPDIDVFLFFFRIGGSILILPHKFEHPVTSRSDYFVVQQGAEALAVIAAEEGEGHLAMIFQDEITLADGTPGQKLDGVNTAHVGLADGDNGRVVVVSQFSQTQFRNPDADGKPGAVVTMKLYGSFDNFRGN